MIHYELFSVLLCVCFSPHPVLLVPSFFSSPQVMAGSVSLDTTARRGRLPWWSAPRVTTARRQASPPPPGPAMPATTAPWDPLPPPRLSVPWDTSASRAVTFQRHAGMGRTDQSPIWHQRESAQTVMAVPIVMAQGSAVSLDLVMSVRIQCGCMCVCVYVCVCE